MFGAAGASPRQEFGGAPGDRLARSGGGGHGSHGRVLAVPRRRRREGQLGQEWRRSAAPLGEDASLSEQLLRRRGRVSRRLPRRVDQQRPGQVGEAYEDSVPACLVRLRRRRETEGVVRLEHRDGRAVPGLPYVSARSSGPGQQARELTQGRGDGESLRPVRVHEPAGHPEYPGDRSPGRGKPGLREDVGGGGRSVGSHREGEQQQHRAEPAQPGRVTRQLRQPGDHRRRRDHDGGTPPPGPRIDPGGESGPAAHARRHGHRHQRENASTARVGQIAPERRREGAQHGVHGEVGPTRDRHRQCHQRHRQGATHGEEKCPVRPLERRRAARGEQAQRADHGRPPTVPGHGGGWAAGRRHVRYIPPAPIGVSDPNAADASRVGPSRADASRVGPDRAESSLCPRSGLCQAGRWRKD